MDEEWDEHVEKSMEHPYKITYWKKYCAFVVTRKTYKGKDKENVYHYGEEVLFDSRPQSYHEYNKNRTGLHIPSMVPEIDFSANDDKDAVRSPVIIIFEYTERMKII